MSDTGKAVFLSYASQDTDAARRIAEALRAEGIEVWFDVSELRGGEAWDASIQKQIAECSVFVAIISANTQSRREGYFRLEWRLADERMRLMAEGTPFVLPVIIDGTKERDALVPKSFLGVQWTWLPHGEVPPAFVARVQKLLGGPEAKSVSPSPRVVVEVARRNFSAPTPSPESYAPARWSTLRFLPWVTTCVLVGVVIWMGLRPMRTGNSAAEGSSSIATHATILLPPQAPLAPAPAMPLGVPYRRLALAPDGANLVYVALADGKTQLWRRPLDGREAQPIPNTARAYCPFFSPDSRWVGFFADDKLKKVSLAGGAPEVLCELAGETHSACWGEDGFVYFVSGYHMNRVPDRGGAREVVPIEQAASAMFLNPAALPGGQHLVGDTWPFLFNSGDFSPLGLYSPAAKSFQPLVTRGHSPRFLPPGFLVFARATGLHAVEFDLQNGAIRNEPVLVLDGVHTTAVSRMALYSVANNGTLIYAAGGRVDHTTPAWITRDGKVSKLPMAAGLYGEPRLSPDGQWVAIAMPDAQDSVWIFGAETGNDIKKFPEPGGSHFPVWLPDSRQLVFASQRDEHWGIYLKDLTRGGAPADLLYRASRPGVVVRPMACSPDASFLVVQEINGPKVVCATLPLQGDRALTPRDLPADAWAIDFTPDGRWITYTSGKGTGVLQVYVRRFPDGEQKQVSTEYGEEGLWSAKADQLYYRHGDTWRVADVTFEPTLGVSAPRVLFSGTFHNSPGYSYAAATDGQRFLVLVPENPPVPITQLEVITNWTAEVARKVAAVNATHRKP